MDSSEGSGDSPSNTEGPSQRNLQWSRGWRHRTYRAWPPTNAQSYPVMKRHRSLHKPFRTGAEMNSYANGDSVDFPGDKILRARWRELADQKIQVYALRSRIKRQTTRNQEAREERDAADNTFMSILRPFHAGISGHGELSHINNLQGLFRHMQETRNICQVHESALQALESDLRQAQDLLDLLERRLINELRDPPGCGATRQRLRLDVPPISQSDQLLGLEMGPARTSHPMYQRLMAAVYQFHSARRYRIELFKRKQIVEEQIRQRTFFQQHHPAALQHVTPLHDSDLDFLHACNTVEQKISNDMSRLHEEVMDIVRRCWEEDIIPRNTTLAESQSWYPGDFSIDEDLNHDAPEARRTTPAQFLTLLSNPASSLLRAEFPLTAEAALREAEMALREVDTSSPDYAQRKAAVDSASKELSIENLLVDAEKGNAAEFINRWMLQMLRTSPHEVTALYSFFRQESRLVIADNDEWQESVLGNWWNDEDSKPSAANFGRADKSLMTAPTTAPTWLSGAFSYSTYGVNDENMTES